MMCPKCSTEVQVPQVASEDDSLPPPLPNTMWFYEVDSQNVGPVHENEIPALVSAGVIRAHTRVWKKGAENWVHAIDTELQHLFASVSGTDAPSAGASTPPDHEVKPPMSNVLLVSAPYFGFETLKDFVSDKLKKPIWIIFLFGTGSRHG